MKQTNLIKTEAYSREEEVRSFEINSEKNMNIAGIARKFQEMAWEHSSQLKCGYKDLDRAWLRSCDWLLRVSLSDGFSREKAKL